ncbi:MAG: ATPase [Lachnospiraceae bacterium]|nr:ATPase [Lachnospiraceae bacterium]
MEKKEWIESGKCAIGIEFGSTRIKTVLTAADGSVIAQGSHTWESHLIDGIWTYGMDEIIGGLQNSYRDMTGEVKNKFDVSLKKVSAIGISAMMHGYLPFDAQGNLLTGFRTWQNTMTGQAAAELSELLSFNIPQRWSIAHLYQAHLNGESHVKDIAFLTTLAGFIHWKLTGEKVLGIGDASGMFPIDSVSRNYDKRMLELFEEKIAPAGYPWTLSGILPKVLCAGDAAGRLTEEGARLLDPSGDLEAGVLLCPPEGDAGTGMTATNSVAVRTGNVSAGTSVFAMVVLEKMTEKVHEEIDMVTTPVGDPVAMVHCNNCTSEINAWAGFLKGFLEEAGAAADMNMVYRAIFEGALKGAPDCGGLMGCNYIAGEPVTGFAQGRPMVLRKPDAEFSFVNFVRMQLMSAVATLKLGMDILTKEEHVPIDKMFGHGGYFKTPVTGQKIMAAALGAPVSVMKTAGEGGSWGIAVLALYAAFREGILSYDGLAKDASLPMYLEDVIMKGQEGSTIEPDTEDVKGFTTFIENYQKMLQVEKAAAECF